MKVHSENESLTFRVEWTSHVDAPDGRTACMTALDMIREGGADIFIADDGNERTIVDTEDGSIVKVEPSRKDTTGEAINNIRYATNRVQLVMGATRNEELAEAIAELEQAIRFLTREETPA